MRAPFFVALLLAGSVLAFAPSASASPPCDPEQPCDPPPHPLPLPDCRKVPDREPVLVVTDDCKVLVTVDPWDCLWAEERVTKTYGPLTVTYTYCTGPDQTMSQAPPPCGCPAPAPLCDPINDMIADNDDVVDWTLSDTCQVTVVVDITKLLACVYGGEAPLSAGPVTVIYPDCDTGCGARTCPPPTGPTAMADPFPTCVRECSPIPMEACELRDATHLAAPALEHPLWGYDCTLDVSTSCTGGASGSYDARVGFVDVSLAKCSGPDWS